MNRKREHLSSPQIERLASGEEGFSEQDLKRVMLHVRSCAWCAEQVAEGQRKRKGSVQVLKTTREEQAEQPLLAAKKIVVAAAGPSRRQACFLRSKWMAGVLVLPLLAHVASKAREYWRQYSAEKSLVQAYTERRTLTLRMAGAGYAPLRIMRGPSEPPVGMLEAEGEIISVLSADPDNPEWLHKKGKAELLFDNYESAVSALEKSHRLAPGDMDISLDLASGYFLRAQKLERTEDYGRAVDVLGRVLANRPTNEVAIFNQALALEHVPLYRQARQEWRRYLELDDSSGWAGEARTHLANVEDKIRLQQERNNRPLLPPARLAEAVAHHDQSVIEEADHRIERYLTAGIEQWLLEAWDAKGGSDAEKLEVLRGLQALATLLVEEHQDYWLRDFLRETGRDRELRMAGVQMARAITVGHSSETATARLLAMRAQSAFHRLRAPAAEMRASLEVLASDRRSHDARPCAAAAASLMRQPAMSLYPLLRGYGLLEGAACGSLGDESARLRSQEALQVAQRHGYRELELRALMFRSTLHGIAGDFTAAWKDAGKGLAEFWSADYPARSGYNFYANLGGLAEEEQQWFLDVALSSEAIAMVAADPDKLMRAMKHRYLANALLMTGDLASAQDNFRQMQVLFEESESGARKVNLKVEAEIGLAGIERMRNEPRNATHRLEGVRAQVEVLKDDDLQLEFYRNSGLAYLQADESGTAEHDLMAALGLAEQSLRENRSERERLIWSRKTDAAYRALVRLKLKQDSEQALWRWEWYKAASLRSGPTKRQADRLAGYFSTVQGLSEARKTLPVDTTVLSYALFPEGMAVWVYNRISVRQIWLPVPQAEIELQARIFAEHCSDEKYNVDSLRREGNKLYRRIVGPLEPWLNGHQRIIVETDGVLGLVPFDALSDNSGRYLADRWLISISPGVYYLAATNPWRGISSESRALVAGDPVAPGYPVLVDAAVEARETAARFHGSRPLLRRDVTAAKILDALSSAEVFHFAGHAVASAAGVGLVTGAKELLDVEKLESGAFRNMQLVVLSACSSAKGASGLLDDRDSLARLLVGGGVPEVIASRWPVDSLAARLMINEFYGALFRGRTVSEALHEAAMKLRDRRDYSHPAFWAGFAAFGRG